jgi:hypothetical protein
MIGSMNEGALLSLTGDLAYKALDKLSDNSQQWDFSSSRDKSAHNPKKGGIYELKEEAEMNIKIGVLTKRLDTLNIGPSINVANNFTVDSYSICASPVHLAQNCPSIPVFSEYSMEQMNSFNDYQKQSNGPYSETYNLGWRNHPNFSWKQNHANQGGASHHAHNQYPLGFPPMFPNHGRSAQPASTSAYQVPAQALVSMSQTLEETLRDFMKMAGQFINDVRSTTMVNT